MINLTGQVFGRLHVTGNDGSMWRCQCSCGQEVSVKRWSLTAGRTRSCGCLLSETASGKGRARLVDLTGQSFGRLTVTGRAPNLYGNATTWDCLCDCGERFIVAASSLQSGNTNSCGCLRRHDHAVITYEAAHWRVRQAKGSASSHACADCGGPAEQWSYDHRDLAAERQAGKGPYSLNPQHYEPRCPSCHRSFDLAHKTPGHMVPVNTPTH